MTNKRNVTMETLSVMFIVSGSDVSQPRRCTYESNDHFYGMCIQILKEFNMEHLVHIADKQRLKMKNIFNSDLLTSSTTSDFKGYNETFPDFLVSLKAAASIVPPSSTIMYTLI